MAHTHSSPPRQPEGNKLSIINAFIFCDKVNAIQSNLVLCIAEEQFMQPMEKLTHQRLFNCQENFRCQPKILLIKQLRMFLFQILKEILYNSRIKNSKQKYTAMLWKDVALSNRESTLFLNINCKDIKLKTTLGSSMKNSTLWLTHHILVTKISGCLAREHWLTFHLPKSLMSKSIIFTKFVKTVNIY